MANGRRLEMLQAALRERERERPAPPSPPQAAAMFRWSPTRSVSVAFIAFAAILTLLPPQRSPAAGTHSKLDKMQTVSGEVAACKGSISEVLLLKDALKYLDANFFNDTKVQEMAKGAEEFNIPAFRVNRRLVASVDGGLHDPSVLVFNSSWGNIETPGKSGKFNYPSLSEVQRPNREDDIAFMTVLELGALIRTKQITSFELTGIFLRRLKRYDHVLEAVISFTEDLAYRQAKKADELLDRGVYLGTN